jgi:hypothetical protein
MLFFGKPFRPNSYLFSMFEMALTKRGRSKWEWPVHDAAGNVVMRGWEISRPEAKYQGDSALFLLLMTTGRIYDPPQTT